MREGFNAVSLIFRVDGAPVHEDAMTRLRRKYSVALRGDILSLKVDRSNTSEGVTLSIQRATDGVLEIANHYGISAELVSARGSNPYGNR